MASDKYLPPTLDQRVPDIATDDDLGNIRRLIYFLSERANTRTIADTIIERLSMVRDEFGELIFTDMRKTAPHIVMAEQLAHIGSMVNYMASNVPLLIEDYLINLMNERPVSGLPEFVWMAYRLKTPRSTDYTITANRGVTNDEGTKRYTSVYDLTIPAGAYGNETNDDGSYKYLQLFRSDTVGTLNAVAPRELKKSASSIAYVEEIFNPDSSFGGRDPEKYASYRTRVFQEPKDQLLISPADYVRATVKFIGPQTRAIVIGNDKLGNREYVNRIRLSAVLPNGDILQAGSGKAIALQRYLKDRDPNADLIVVSPVVKDIGIAFKIVMESIADFDREAVITSLDLAMKEFSNPIRWEDWGEKNNNFNLDKLTTFVKSQLDSVDTISIIRLEYDNGVLVSPIRNDLTINLEPVIGLPRFTLLKDATLVTREDI